jgi:hypothetical protein
MYIYSYFVCTDVRTWEALWFVLFTQYLSDGKIEKNEMGKTCSVYGREERRIQGFGGETWGKKATWETQSQMGE